MKDTGLTLFGLRVYESEHVRESTRVVIATQQRVSLQVRSEFDANGKPRFVASIKDETE